MVCESVVAHRNALGIEGVGLDDVGTGLKIFAMNVSDDERRSEREHVVAALQVSAVVGKTCPTEVLFAQPILLNHRTHRTVEDKDFVALNIRH